MKNTSLIVGLLFVILMAGILMVTLRACEDRQGGKVVSSAKELRTATASIRTEISSPLRKFFLKVIADPKASNRKRTGALRAILSRSGGSGFVVEVKDGRSLIVTNAHVVSAAQRVDVSFDEGRTWHTGKTLYENTARDVAIVEIPVEAAYRFKLELNPSDFNKVVAVGLPYLTEIPNYQITEGVIANKCFEGSPEFFGTRRPCLIQHTAFINPGSSGGPLVNTDNWAVVGINSYQWGKWTYEGVYLAVPSMEIRTVLEHAKLIRTQSKKIEWQARYLRKICNWFFEELASEEPDEDQLSYISDELIVAQGWKAFDEWKKSSKEFWFSSEPYESLKMALLEQIRADLRRKGMFGTPENTFRACDQKFRNDEIQENTAVRVQVELTDGFRETAWRFESGTWRLSRYYIPNTS